MNPENVGEHIKLQHSLLWRKPFSYQKKVPDSNSCHHQLNELGNTGISWRARNNNVSTHSSGFRNKSQLVRKTNSYELEELLTVKDKQPNQQRSLVKSLRPDADSIDRSKALVEGMRQLQKLDLLRGKDLNETKFPGIIRYNHIHNDYHERVANPGFSRNQLGKFFTK